MGALPLNPTIFREKLSKAFVVLGRGSTQVPAFQRCAFAPQGEMFVLLTQKKKAASETEAAFLAEKEGFEPSMGY